jgi:hypothetical protein
MYSQLKSSRSEIRTLDLFPGAWDDAIEGRLQAVSLDNQLTFKAISYVWGDSQHKREIIVDDRPVSVTQNLFTGLQRIRDPTARLTIWVDALCINQADDDERCSQVQLMRKIYTSATEVLIWLGYGADCQVPIVQPKIYRFTGEASDINIVDAYFANEEGAYTTNREDVYFANKDDPLFTVENDICYTNEGVANDRDSAEDILGAFVYFKLRASNKHANEIGFLKTNGTELQVHRSWSGVVHAVNTLKKCPWWTRIWVLQEVVLARKATVIYNSVSAPWNMLIDAVNNAWLHDQFCCKNIMQQRPGPETNLLTEYKATIVSDMEAMRLGLGSDAMTLSQVMKQSVGRDATDPRDHVYGLLGLVTNWYRNAPLVPDYSKSIQEILIQAQYIEVRGSPGVSGLIGDPRSDISGLPSWVTQVSSTRQRLAAGLSRYQRASLFHAAGRSRANIRKVDDNLSVECFNPIDVVASLAVSSIGQWMFQDLCAWRRAFDVISEWQKLSENLDRDHCSSEAFMRTILNDCIILHPREQYEEKQQNSILKSACRRVCAAEIPSMFGEWWNWVQSRATVNDDGTYDDVESLAPNSDNITLFCQSFFGATAYRRFFITRDGRMGIGPESIQPGDQVVIMCGGKVPFAIRRDNSGHSHHAKLVGDLYIHGVMDGEGVPANHGQEDIVQILLT